MSVYRTTGPLALISAQNHRLLVLVRTAKNEAATFYVLSRNKITIFCQGVGWLSGRASDSGARGQGFETDLRCVMSLSKTLYSPKVLVIPRKRWLRPDMMQKLLTWTLSLNTNKQNYFLLKGCYFCSHKYSIIIQNACLDPENFLRGDPPIPGWV